MKKTIFYLAFVLALALPKTTLAFPSGGSGEGEQPDPGQGAVVHHEHSVGAEVEALRQQVDDLKALLEIQAQAQLQALQGLQGQPPLGDNVDVPALSPHQQLLLARWEQGQIGPEAWDTLSLGKSLENPSRAAKLFGAIQEHPGEAVDIFYLGGKDFTVITDPVKNGEEFVGGKVIDKIYKF